MSLSNQNNPCVLVAHIGTISDAGDFPVVYLPKKFVLLGAYLLNQADIAASDTNYITLTLKQGSTSLATLDTRAANNGAVTANTAKAFTLAAAYDGAEQEPLPAGDVKMTYAEGGSGTTTKAQVQLYGYWK